jgi:hypothetical protein
MKWVQFIQETVDNETSGYTNNGKFDYLSGCWFLKVNSAHEVD